MRENVLKHKAKKKKQQRGISGTAVRSATSYTVHNSSRDDGTPHSKLHERCSDFHSSQHIYVSRTRISTKRLLFEGDRSSIDRWRAATQDRALSREGVAGHALDLTSLFNSPQCLLPLDEAWVYSAWPSVIGL